MFKVGEETGTLDEQLEMAAASTSTASWRAASRSSRRMFEPIMIVFVGVIVGFVAVALVSAMYGVLDGIKEQRLTLPGQRARTRSTKCCP